MKRIISILAVLCLLLTMMPLSAWAKTVDKVQQVDLSPQVNPLYADVLDQETLEKELAKLPDPVEPYGNEYVSVEEGVQQIRDQMKLRTPSFTIRVRTTTWDLSTVIGDMFYAAFDHTGVPTEGDYLMWQWGMWQLDDWDYYTDGDVIYLEVVYGVMYYNDAAQEAQLNTAVAELLEELDLEGLTDYEKICGIYGYITENIVYDYYHLGTNPNYMPMYTAYAALVDGTAVCQGYANLFYRLALELGVDTRIVVGVGWTGSEWGSHAWNLVEIDGTYYYVDSTWDATYAQAGYPYQWYLKGSGRFSVDHQNDPGWTEWLPDYNVSVTDYESDVPVPDPSINWPVSGTCGDNVTWSLAEDGLLTISGTGAMWDYPEEYPGWFQYADWVRECVIEEGVTTVGSFAFYLCEQLTSVTVADSVDSIYYGAFANCDRLTSVTMGSGVSFIDEAVFYGCISLSSAAIPEGITSIGADTFDGCYSLASVTIPVSVTAIGAGAFYNCFNLRDVYYGGTEEQWVQISIDEWNDALYYATIHCTDPAPAVPSGDANGDGDINALDLILLRQYLAGWSVTVDATGGDTNADGTVNALDLILLRQYLAGWDVTLGPQE